MGFGKIINVLNQLLGLDVGHTVNTGDTITKRMNMLVFCLVGFLPHLTFSNSTFIFPKEAGAIHKCRPILLIFLPLPEIAAMVAVAFFFLLLWLPQEGDAMACLPLE